MTNSSEQRPKKKLSKQAARRLLWLRGNLSWKLHAGQRVIEEAYRKVTKKLFVANCARRFGKTFWACTKAVEKAISCPNRLPRIKYAAATKIDLEEFVIPCFDLILEDCPDEVRPVFKASKSKYVFPHNGAEIQLVGLDKRPDGGRGNYCDLYIFEEAGLIASLKYLYGSVVGPMMVRRPGGRILMLSTPPVTPAHAFQEFCGRAKLQDAYAELNIYSNPLLTPEDIESAHEECIDESEWLREYMCQFVVDQSRAIVPEWHDDYILEAERPAQYFAYLHRYEAMDLGVKVDLTAILFGWWHPKEKLLYIEDEAEITGPQMNTVALKDLIKKKEQDLWGILPVYRRVADNDNPLLLQDLASLHGIYFMATGKDELHAMVNETRVFIKNARLRVHPRCKKLLGCLKYGIWNKLRTQFDRDPMYGHFDHFAALVYLIRNLDQNSDPVPELLGFNEKTMWKRPSKKDPKNVSELRKMINQD